MLLFFRSLPRLYQMAMTDMRRHISMTISSILSISIALLLSMVMMMIALNVDHVSTNVEAQLQVQVALSPYLSEIQSEDIYKQIMQVEGVVNAEYSSKEEELQKLIAENGEMFEQYKDSNPLYNVYVVEVDPSFDLQAVSTALQKIKGVDSADFGGRSVVSLVSVFETLRHIGYAAAGTLMILGVFLIRSTINMTISLRDDEIFIMRTVGAYNFYIALPFILEGLSMGFFAALLPGLLAGIGYPWLYHILNQALGSQTFSLLAPGEFLPGLLFYDFAAGLILGALGSFLAVFRMLRRVR